jgi:hypothetical protein
MSEWWTYRLADMLMFSPRTYWRLVELYNRELWPAHAVALAAGAFMLWRTAHPGPQGHRWCGLLLAAAWFWVAWGFHWQRYASIHLAASWFAAAFALQGVLLLAWAVLPERPSTDRAPVVRIAGLLPAATAVLAYPLAGLLFGRPLAQAEVAGLMPEPTALATAGLLLGWRPRAPGVLFAIPLAWLLVAAAMLWTMATQ